MFAYILTKTRSLGLKIVREKNQGYFKYRGFEYTIDRNAVYSKKLLGVKRIFWSMYLEGNTNPLVFNERTYSMNNSDVPIDEIALLIRKVMRGMMDLIIILLIAFNLIVSIVIAGRVFNG